ncbi:MAG TPA: hypothetical protein PK156_33145 [Polyangium sp.]|nr:hypothetical protein [Polyangium sp.]
MRSMAALEWRAPRNGFVIVALLVMVGGCSKALAPTPQIQCPPPANVEKISEIEPRQLSIPDNDLGWYQSERCTYDWVAEEKPIWFRIAHDHVDMLAEDYAERFDVELSVTKQDEWSVFSGNYEVGKAIWMVDGYVIVQGPLVSPRMREGYTDQKGLKTIYRRITFIDQPDGMVVSLVPANNTGDHSRFGWLECKLYKLPKELQAHYDMLFDRETSPLPCAEAQACCQAIKSAGRGASDESTADVCNGRPDLTPRYCRNWMATAINDFRWGIELTCTPQRDGQQLCSFGHPPKKPRVVPEACVSSKTRE